MLSILDQTAPLADRVSRREWLRVGGLSALGVSLPDLLRAGEAASPRPGPTPKLAGDLGSTFGKAKNVIFLWLQGGPPQHETFDPKPDAPAEIRGPFKPIATNVPGIRFCELLPRTARHADKLAVVRSLSHPRRQPRRQRLLAADRLPLRPRQCPADQADRLALLRLDRQDAQAEREAAGADVGLAPGRDAAQRQRHAGRADGRASSASCGSRSGSSATRPRRTTRSKGWR